jgi:hypothetical protein
MVAVEARVRAELVGAVALVPEHHRIDARGLERREVRPRALHQRLDSAFGVVQGRARQGAEVHHRDYGLARAEHPPEPLHPRASFSTTLTGRGAPSKANSSDGPALMRRRVRGGGYGPDGL